MTFLRPDLLSPPSPSLWLRDLLHEFDETLPSLRTAPVQTFAADISETEDGYEVLAELPGVGRDHLDLAVENSVLRVSGTWESPAPKDEEDESAAEATKTSVEFRRSFSIPEDVDASNIDAKLTDGLLRISLPKAEESKPRRITVQ
ncbi:MAG: Hsp20/alpha crystallin family protein [Verrucomicrobiota bacterium]